LTRVGSRRIDRRDRPAVDQREVVLIRSEEERVVAEFRRRDQDRRYSDRYSIFTPSHLFLVQGRERYLLRFLAEARVRELAQARILDVGCGSGQELGRFAFYGASRANMVGLDLERDRLARAAQADRDLRLVQGNAAALPFRSGSFDLVVQFTVFSSILDRSVRQHAAQEMVRVLKGNGHILWYDCWINPINPNARGIGLREIRALFEGCRVRARRVTLVPPIARVTVRLSWMASSLLEAFPFLRTHYLALISPA
jgi:SAM-dependent methyltransferase